MSLSKLTNNFCLLLFLLSLTVGNVFYDLIGFNYIDELVVLILLLYYLFVKIKKNTLGLIDKELLYFVIIAIAYLVYSLIIRITVVPAIFLDFQQQIKPFLSFYCIMGLKPQFSPNQKKMIRFTCLLSFFILLIATALGNLDRLYSHMTFFASATSMIALSYFSFSSQKTRNVIIMIMILSLGLFSVKAKFAGEFVCILLITFLIKGKVTFNFKMLLSVLIIFVLTIFVAWAKIDNYFIAGAEVQARPILYKHALVTLNNYIPFGSGLGTYGTDASRVYYSPLYFEYGMDNVWGLSPEMDDFIADTFFPVLCQFGYVGILLFCLFWKRVYKRALNLILSYNDLQSYKIALMVLSIIFIESIADSTILSYRGVPLMMLLGLVISMNSNKKQKTNKERIVE